MRNEDILLIATVYPFTEISVFPKTSSPVKRVDGVTKVDVKKTPKQTTKPTKITKLRNNQTVNQNNGIDDRALKSLDW